MEIPRNRKVSLGHVIQPASNRRIVYELKPKLSVLYAGEEMTTNSRGFRCREIEQERSAGTFRIVGIGDSAMFGTGVSDGQNHLAIMEGIVGRRFPALTIETVNTAVPGYNTVMEVETLKDKGLAFSPDVVMIQFVANDLSVPNFVRKLQQPLSLTRCFLWSFVKKRISGSAHRDAPQRDDLDGFEKVPMKDRESWGRAVDPNEVPEEYRELVGWQAFADAMEELRGLSFDHNFKVIWLSLSHISKGKVERAGKIAATLGFDVIDIGPYYRDHLAAKGTTAFLGSDLSVSDSDPHPSVLAHTMAAEVVAEHLIGYINERADK